MIIRYNKNITNVYIYIMGKIISGKPQIERDVMVILQIDGRAPLDVHDSNR